MTREECQKAEEFYAAVPSADHGFARQAAVALRCFYPLADACREAVGHFQDFHADEHFAVRELLVEALAGAGPAD